MGTFGLTGSPADENDKTGKWLRFFDGRAREFQKMISIATDDDSLLPLGKFKDRLVRRPDGQDFPQVLHVVFPISQQFPLRPERRDPAVTSLQRLAYLFGHQRVNGCAMIFVIGETLINLRFGQIGKAVQHVFDRGTVDD